MSENNTLIESLEVKRLRLWDAAQSDLRTRKAVLDECAEDPIFWINNFCWTYDPRNGGKLPFLLYPFQEELITKLCSYIDNQENVGIEKSRDMGVSWILLLVFQWYWLFKPSSNFLIGSRKEEYVDKLGDMSTLFEKLRFNLKNIPAWMRPEGFDDKKHNTFMKAVNPVNNNTITGESSNTDFGRGGRYTAIAFDEFAFWPFSEGAWVAASQSSPCLIPISTPYGKGNKYGKLMTSKEVGEKIQNKITIHWRKHPRKTNAWYEGEKNRMSEDEIARELDISYDFSVKGVVFKEFSPQIHKVATPYKFNPYWKTVVAFDFGSTCAFLVSQIDPQDRLHVFHECILYQNGNTEDIADAWNAYSKTLELESTPIYVCDPAGVTGEFKTKEKLTDIQILQNAGIKGVQYYKAQKMRDRLVNGVKMAKALLSRMTQGQPKIRVYEEHCETLIEAFQSEYRYKENNKGERLDIIDEKHPWEDIMDCFRYTIIEQFSVIDSKPEKVEQPPIIEFEV